MSDLDILARDLAAAPDIIARKVSARMVAAQRALLAIARQDVHVVSGDLRDSLYIEAPSYFGAELSEFNVSARVSYAAFEVARGGAHDYVARTLEDGAGIIDSAAADIADLAVQTIVGSD